MSLDKFNFVKKVDKEEGKGLSTNDYTDLDQVEVQNLRTNKTKAKQIQVEDRGSTPPNSPDVQTALENIFDYMQVLDPDEVLNIIQDLEMDISGKVDKIAGKGLSTEDFTTTEKNKLAGIEAGAQVNTVTSAAGTYTGTADSGTTVNVGFAPKFVLSLGNNCIAIRLPTRSTQIALDRSDEVHISENTINKLTSTGFVQEATGVLSNRDGTEYAYIAIG